MKPVLFDIETCHLLICYFNAFWVPVLIKLGVDGQSCFGRRIADEVNYDSLTDKGPSSPVVRNVAEHPVFDLIPLTRAGREVAHRHS